MPIFLYFFWLAFCGFGDLITFQSITALPHADLMFSIALILLLVLYAAMIIRPRWWNIIPAFTVNIGALVTVAVIMSAPKEPSYSGWDGLASSGHHTAMLQVLSIFILLFLVTTVLFLRGILGSDKGHAPK